MRVCFGRGDAGPHDVGGVRDRPGRCRGPERHLFAGGVGCDVAGAGRSGVGDMQLHPDSSVGVGRVAGERVEERVTDGQCEGAHEWSPLPAASNRTGTRPQRRGSGSRRGRRRRRHRRELGLRGALLGLCLAGHPLEGMIDGESSRPHDSRNIRADEDLPERSGGRSGRERFRITVRPRDLNFGLVGAGRVGIAGLPLVGDLTVRGVR